MLLMLSCNNQNSTNNTITSVDLPDVTDIPIPNLDVSNEDIAFFSYALSPDARYIAVRSRFDVRVLETLTGNEVFKATIDDASLPEDNNNKALYPRPISLEFTDNGKYLVIGAAYRKKIEMTAAEVIDVATWKKLNRINPMHYWHSTSDGDFIAGFRPAMGNTIVCGSLPNATQVQEVARVDSVYDYLGFIANTARCILHTDNAFYVYDAPSGTKLHALAVPPQTYEQDTLYHWGYRYFYQNNRNIIAQEKFSEYIGKWKSHYTFFDAQANTVLGTLDLEYLSSLTIAFHPNKLIALQADSMYEHSAPRIYQVSGNKAAVLKQYLQTPAPNTGYSFFQFSADGKYLAASRGFSVRIWKVKI